MISYFTMKLNRKDDDIMKTTKKFISSIVAIALLTGVFSGSVYADNNQHKTTKTVYEIIDELNASESGMPSGITKEDIDRVINEGGVEGANALQHIYEISTPVDYILDDDVQSATNNRASEHYSYKYDVSTGLSEYVDGSEFDHEPVNKVTDGVSIGNDNNERLPNQTRDYPYWWYESSPQSYDNTRSTCKLTIVTNGYGSYSGSGFLIANNYVGTAGHCIFDNDYGPNNWCSYIIVTPSANGTNNSAPYGTRTSTTVEVGGNWADHYQDDDDWGVIQLNSSFSIGYMGMMCPGNNIVGWGSRAQGWRSGYDNMYLCWGNITSATDRLINVTQNVYPGMSGGPLLEGDDHIIGFVRAYIYSGTDPGYGVGEIVKFDNWLFNKMTSYQ